MRIFRRDAAEVTALAEAKAVESRTDVERQRALAELRREEEAAQRQADDAARVAEQARQDQRAADRRVLRARFLAHARLLAPLLIVNALAVSGQVAYAFKEVAPSDWSTPARAVAAVVFAMAVESVALYVSWHAHDALLMSAHATANRLRRAAYGIAGVVGALNYSHFAGEHLGVTPAAVGFGMASLLSPWLWGLHTRRQQHVQLLQRDLVDDGGATFSADRRRAFPFRSWGARRWSIDHSVQDPKQAWAGYNAERQARLAALPDGRLRAVVTSLRGEPKPTKGATVAETATVQATATVGQQPTVGQVAPPDGEAKPIAAEDAKAIPATVRQVGTVDPLALLDRPADVDSTDGHDDGLSDPWLFSRPVQVSGPGHLLALLPAFVEPAVSQAETVIAPVDEAEVSRDVTADIPTQPEVAPLPDAGDPPANSAESAEKSAPRPRRTRTAATRSEPTTAEKVAKAARRKNVTKDKVAEQLGISLRTVQRNWPTDRVNGNVPALTGGTK